jgi:hypothetical protein
MANDTIRVLCDGEELVLAEEPAPAARVPARELDPRADGLERRHRALATRPPARPTEADASQPVVPQGSLRLRRERIQGG